MENDSTSHSSKMNSVETNCRIQKRKDRPSNWFSNCPVSENPAMKRIMSGRMFSKMLQYLHVCSNSAVHTVEDYDPAYKVVELRDYLQQRFTRLFEPGQQLSLDETLIRTFGRVRFKVRIISKSARYGIKIYVLTDAVTAFVLRIIIYTGKHTYNESANQNEKKTVQVVKELCKPLQGTHRTLHRCRATKGSHGACVDHRDGKFISIRSNSA